MEDLELKQKLDTLEIKIDRIFTSTEKTRKYFQWLLIISIVVIVLPAIGLVFAVPSFISTYSSMHGLLQ